MISLHFFFIVGFNSVATKEKTESDFWYLWVIQRIQEGKGCCSFKTISTCTIFSRGQMLKVYQAKFGSPKWYSNKDLVETDPYPGNIISSFFFASEGAQVNCQLLLCVPSNLFLFSYKDKQSCEVITLQTYSVGESLWHCWDYCLELIHPMNVFNWCTVHYTCSAYIVL